jgi:hypothetical protein
MFWTVPLFIIRSSSLHYTICRTENQTGSVLILLASCQQTCMTYTIAMCTSSWFYYKNVSVYVNWCFCHKLYVIWLVPKSRIMDYVLLKCGGV